MATVNGTSGNDSLTGTSGNDTLNGLGGNDTLLGSGGTDFYDGGSGSDALDLKAAPGAVTVSFSAGTVSGGFSGTFAGIERVIGSDAGDSLMGAAGAQTLSARAGNDTLAGGAGIDTLYGGTGADHFVFQETGSANADRLNDFASGSDKIVLDAGVMSALGASGNFAGGDARFWASASGTAHDADDRVIYNTTTRQVFYDADGSGSGTAVLIATLQSGATLVASDIVVQGSGGGGGGSGTIVGTEGDETLTGTEGNDTIEGRGGNDSLIGRGGADSLSGGDGNDTLDGLSSGFAEWEPDVDTLAGGMGNDLFFVDNPADVLSDTGGVDTVVAHNMSWTLGAGYENLAINNGEIETRVDGIGNELGNVLDGSNGDGPSDGWHVFLDGRGGNDTILGSVQDDVLLGGDGNDWIESGEDADSVDGGAGDDTLDGGPFGDDDLTGGAGADHFVLAAPTEFPNRIHDFVSGTDKLTIDGNRFLSVGASGNFTANDERFFAGAAAHDASDRVIWDGSRLWYDSDGTGPTEAGVIADLSGPVAAADIEVINGTGGGQTINGTSGNDTLSGTAGNDTINGLGGNDLFVGGSTGGADVIDGGAGRDSIEFKSHATSAMVVDFASGKITGGSSGTISFTNIERIVAGTFNDTMIGSAAGQTLTGQLGQDSIWGAGGTDTLWGGVDDADVFVFREMGAANADRISDFASGLDKVQLDDAAFSAIGAMGNFTAGDARFWSSGTGTAHDANDRVIFNTSTGDLYYDADGNGSGAAQLIATVQSGATVAASDIVVI